MTNATFDNPDRDRPEREGPAKATSTASSSPLALPLVPATLERAELAGCSTSDATHRQALGFGACSLPAPIVARAIHDAIARSHPRAFVDEFSLDEPVVIDGRFHLEAIAHVLSINLLHALAAQACAQQEQMRR